MGSKKVKVKADSEASVEAQDRKLTRDTMKELYAARQYLVVR